MEVEVEVPAEDSQEAKEHGDEWGADLEDEDIEVVLTDDESSETPVALVQEDAGKQAEKTQHTEDAKASKVQVEELGGDLESEEEGVKENKKASL